MPERRPPSLAMIAVLAFGAMAAACRGEPPVTRDIDVREMDTEEAHRTAAAHELLSQMREFEVPERLIYDAPTPLTRPAAATEWPPPPPSAGGPPAPAQRDTGAARPGAARDTTRRN
jgi:hypothetical protein